MDCGTWAVGHGLWDVGCGTWTVGHGLWDVDCGTWTVGLRDIDCGTWTLVHGLWDMGCGTWAVGTSYEKRKIGGKRYEARSRGRSSPHTLAFLAHIKFLKINPIKPHWNQSPVRDIDPVISCCDK